MCIKTHIMSLVETRRKNLSLVIIMRNMKTLIKLWVLLIGITQSIMTVMNNSSHHRLSKPKNMEKNKEMPSRQ